jgi:hypothetical protein
MLTPFEIVLLFVFKAFLTFMFFKLQNFTFEKHGLEFDSTNYWNKLGSTWELEHIRNTIRNLV